MAYTPKPFAYSLSPFDTQDLTTETADILDTRDTQLTNYLQNETSAIKTETDSLTTALAGKLDSSRFRFGTTVLNLPAVGGSVTVTFSPAYPTGTTNIYVVITNGDYAANTAVLEAGIPDRFGFDVYRVSGGTTGAGFRVNYIAFTI